MKSILIHCSGNNPYYTRIVNTLIKKNKNFNIVLIDYSKILYLSNDLYHNKLVNLFNLDKKIDKTLKSGLSYNRPMRYDIEPLTINTALPINMESSIESSLITLLRDDTPTKNWQYKRMYNIITSDYLNVYKYLLRFFSENKIIFEKAYIPNGRFSHQVIMRHFSNKYAKNVFFYERGLTSEAFFLENYLPQDRVALNEHFTSKPISYWSGDFASRFIENKLLLKEQTDFNKRWQNNTRINHLVKGRVITIFLSSMDEFVALGKNWSRKDNLNQYESIRKLVSNNAFEDYSIIIRCHPNLITKKPRYVFRELIFILSLLKLKLNIKIVSPTSRINSYNLIMQSTGVAVWDSTIGLEAAAIGSTVINLAPALYTPSIQTIDLSQTSIENLTLSHLNGDKKYKIAIAFINFLNAKNHKLEYTSTYRIPFIYNFLLTFPTGGGTSYLLDRIIFSLNVQFNRTIFMFLSLFKRSKFY